MKKKVAGHKEKLTAVEQLQEKPTEFLIVGIGASAGGIQALQAFFRQVPADSHMAYVVILHLSPDHDSQLATVLQRETVLPVLQVKEKVIIEPDHIYVVPPDRHLPIDDGYIAVLPNLSIEERRAPVDIFFRSLADQHGPRAISVVLSGTGANGSMGLKRIKERGGATFVQNPREAEFNEMPRNSIATELVDEVLNVGEIPARIIAYRDSIGTVQIIEEAEIRPEVQQTALREIFTQLRVRTGHDFSNYKRPTLLRRIERRINVHNLPDLPSYTTFLHEHPDETYALLKDLLISVTNFFRDSKAFNALEAEVLPAIFARKTSADQVRIWVAGCATGEEAYSIAMLCVEQANAFDGPKVQIFATDIDETAIATAREGLYTLNDAADVSAERLRRFFTRVGDGYRVRREIREMILFAHHNFLKDPPFSKLDLVTCRNVFIYLNATAQERVTETFHFALKPKGFLFLGTSESVDGASYLYAVHSRDHHIFQAREVAPSSYPVPESVPQFHFPKNDLLQKPDERDNRGQRISFGELHQRMLEQYAPPSVVINEEYEIVHMTERAGKYFEFAGGEPTQNLLKIIRPQVRLELRSALYQAVQNKTVVEARNIKLTINGEAQSLDIQVRPVLEDGDTAKGFILVIFKPAEGASPGGPTVKMASDEPMARQLEEELIGLKTQLRNSIEQHEYQAEELKASNEELQAMNEELRSAAEELETSKEELQSINEELRTVNQELKVKIDEIGVTSNNLQNLVNSANVGTIFLDRSFAIRLFTPAILDIFNLKISDYGRPVTDITNKLQYNGLLHDAEIVLEKLTVVEREVTTLDNRFFMMRVLPYRTSEDRINGVVITFFDITARRESEEALRLSEERMRLLIQSAKDYAIFTLDKERNIVSWSTGAEMMMGYLEAEITGKPADIIFTPEDRAKQAPEKEAQNAEKEGLAENERWHLRKDGHRFWGSGSVSPLRDSHGNLLGFVKIMRDLTEQRQIQEALRQSEQRLQRMVNVPRVGVLTFDYAGALLHANDAFIEMLGYSREEFSTGQFSWRDFTPPQHVEASLQILEQIKHTKRGGPYEKEYLRKDGSLQWMMFVAADLEDGTIVEYAVDISERKQVEEALRRSEERLQLATKAAKMGTFVFYPHEDRDEPDEQMLTLFGLPPNGKLNLNEALDHIIHPDDREQYADEIKQATDPAGNGELDSDIRIIHPDGSVHWVNVAAKTNFEGEPPQAVKMPGVAVDITERKQAQQLLYGFNARLEQEVTDRTHELHVNYMLLQTIYDTTQVGMSVFEAVRDEQEVIIDFKVMMVNKKIEKSAGRNDMVGKLYSEMFPGIRQIGLFDFMVKTFETGEPAKMEYHYTYEGIDKWYSTMFIKGEDILVSTNLDITERMVSEEKRLRSFILLQQSEELAGIGSWDYDLLNGNFIWSEGMYRLFNVQKGVEIRPEIYLQYATAACKETASRIVRHIENGDAEFDESLEIQVGETIKVVKLKAAVVSSTDGTPVRVLGVDMDVTATRIAEERLRRMEAEQQLEIFRVTLRTQEEERRRISESLHNGLGQMLYGIKISLSQLSIKQATEKPKDFETAKRYTSDLLSDAIRDSRRISHELMPAVLEEFGLKAAVEEVCRQMQDEIKFTCSINLGDAQIDKYMQLAVFRILQELMINIVKHAQASKARAVIRYQDMQLKIRVSDNGLGIDPEKQGKEGIGLTSIKSKVNLLNGKLDIDSSAEKGTTIKVVLPYIPVKTN